MRYAALLRGINVGTARRVAMADLRALLTGLGYMGVRTLLNSGNAVFDGPDGTTREVAAAMEAALAEMLAVPARVIVLTAESFAEVVAANPLAHVATNPSRLIVACVADGRDLASLRPLLERDWAPEALAVGEHAAYMWCPEGTVASPLARAVARALGERTTTRSWATALRIGDLLGGEGR